MRERHRSVLLSRAISDFLEALPFDVLSAGPFQPIMRLLLRMGLRTDAVQELMRDDTLQGPYRQRLAKLVDRPAHLEFGENDET